VEEIGAAEFPPDGEEQEDDVEPQQHFVDEHFGRHDQYYGYDDDWDNGWYGDY
jgi:hypothetical protein